CSDAQLFAAGQPPEMLWCCRAATSASPALITSLLSQSDHFGPMLIRPTKVALYISTAQPPLDCLFTDHLKANGWQVTTTTPILAPSVFQQCRPLLVLIDNRLPDLPALSKTLHCLPAADEVLFVAISDRPVSEKRRRSLSQADLYHVVLSSSTDIALCEFFARLANRLRAIPALFAVVDEAEQPVEICDETRTVQYVNRAYESLTGCIRNEVLGRKSSDARRKSLHSFVPRVKDIDGEGIRRASSEWHCIQVPGSSASAQYVYVKRNSADQVMCRDISLKSVRSQSALVDAPITEALSSTELYAPSITRFANSDRIATGYYDGLIRLHHPTRQRKRSLVDAFKDKRNASGEVRRRVSADVKNALSNDQEWGFDILQLERVTENHALTHLGIKIFERWKVHETLRCSSDLIARWFRVIENHYHSLNPYHNATHAADVLQATSYFLDSPAVANHVQDTHATAALIAAAVHDLDHPGRGNAFLINTRQSLALLYNDQSVLENHHVALAFQLTLQQSNNVNIFARLSRDEFVAIRQAVVDMVLATDMCRHFEYLTKFQQTIANLHECDEEKDTASMTICRMLIKCADIGNPTREWSLCQKWAMRIVEEYFDQTCEEREKGLPLTMELFDRNTCNVPLTQCGFIDMFARETFTSWSEFAELPELLQQLEVNYENWRQQTSTWNPAKNGSLMADT
uniref:Phosphodiesterase n=1 Tax=Parascaris univalens TaxID=6257 RepID=A0A915BQX4_PARUN